MRCVLCVRVVVIVVLVVVVSRQLPDFQTMIEFRRLYCMVVFIIIIILVELICSNNYTFIGSTPPNPRYSLDTGGEHEIQTMHVKESNCRNQKKNSMKAEKSSNTTFKRNSKYQHYWKWKRWPEMGEVRVAFVLPLFLPHFSL